MGKDRLGWKYLVEVGDSTRQILARRSHFIAKAERRQEAVRVFDTTMFGLFNLTSSVRSLPHVKWHCLTSFIRTATMMLQQPAVMEKPQLKPSPGDHTQNTARVPYPLPSEPPVPEHARCVMPALLDLQLIVSDISTFFGEEHLQPQYRDIEAMVDSFYRNLKQWSLHIPECISLGNESTPAVMDMQ